MQLILVVGTFVVGVTFASHNGAPPLKYLVLVLISIVAAVPLVLLQSVLSMYLKSFAAPIAWSFLGLIIGIAFSFAPGWIRDLGWLFPYSLVSRSLSLISVATGTTGTSIDMGSVVTIFLSSAVLAGVFLIGFVRVFTNREYS